MNPEDLAVMVIPMMIFGIPIIAILTSHQRKMAELIHGKQAENNQVLPLAQEVERLRHEVAYLRQQMNEQSIALDDLRSGGSSLPSSDVSGRLSQGQ